MRIDWQAYLDGSMNPDEMEAAESELRSNPAARRELEGLRSFVQTLGACGQAEHVPIERLSAKIPTRTQNRVSTRLSPIWGVGFLGTAVAALVAFWVVRSQSIPFESLDFTTNQPELAARWAAAKLDRPLPAFDMGKDALLFYVHQGPGKCCFDYEVGGKTYHVNVKPAASPKRAEGQRVRLSTGVLATIQRGVRWNQAGLDLYIVGPDEDVSRRLADRASASLFDHRPSQLSKV